MLYHVNWRFQFYSPNSVYSQLTPRTCILGWVASGEYKPKGSKVRRIAALYYARLLKLHMEKAMNWPRLLEVKWLEVVLVADDGTVFSIVQRVAHTVSTSDACMRAQTQKGRPNSK